MALVVLCWKCGDTVVTHSGSRYVRCRECSGENSRISYERRSRALASNLHAAAIEELRMRAAVERVKREVFGWGGDRG